MKTAAIWTAVVAVAALASDAAAKTAQKEEGYCKDDTTCAKLAPGYTCVSVQTTRENTEEVKQCLPYKVAGDVCAGISPGLCPSFSTWSKEFKSISSVCAYIIPTAKCAADNTADSTKGTVSCLNVTATATSETKYGVIYGCVDYDGSKLLHEANSKSAKMATAFNYSAIISAGCVNPKNAAGSDVVCSGRGTCAPNAASQMDYKCLCNVGYSGTYCQKIDSNKCTMTAQCAAGKCDLIGQECKCEAGTTGNQCAECDPTSSSACNKHGTCGMSPGTVSAAGRRWLMAQAGSGSGATGNNTVGSTTNSNTNTNTNSSSTGGGNTCTCESGYAGAHCDRKLAGTQKTTTKPTTDSSTETPAPSKDSSASSVAFSTVAVVSTLLVAALL